MTPVRQAISISSLKLFILKNWKHYFFFVVAYLNGERLFCQRHQCVSCLDEWKCRLLKSSIKVLEIAKTKQILSLRASQPQMSVYELWILSWAGFTLTGSSNSLSQYGLKCVICKEVQTNDLPSKEEEWVLGEPEGPRPHSDMFTTW